MNDTFANLYEALLRHPQFSTIVFDGQDYIWLGLFMLGIPLLLTLIFYKFWDPSPTKIYKWVIIVLLTIIVVFGISFYWLSTGSLEDSFINEEQGVLNFSLTLSLDNAIYSLLIALIYSFLVKRFSINNTNNPF